MLASNQSHTSRLFTQLTQHTKMDWLQACQWLEQNGESYCIATIIAEVGSVPRANGSKMVISNSSQFDTLGGGNLEHQVIQKARQQLTAKQQSVAIERFSLAADLNQCCGGAVQVMFETMNCQRPKVVIYGAGHVSQALCGILNQLPCHVTVIDSRPEWLEQISASGIHTIQHNEPVETLANLDSNALILIMTHDHALDFELTKNALQRNCFTYVGLIGSEGKKQRFEFRLREQLSDSNLLKGLTCPIGHSDIKGKLPMQVAVSVSAQLMDRFDHLSEETATQHNGQQNSKATDHTQKYNEQQWQQANNAKKTLESMPKQQASKDAYHD